MTVGTIMADTHATGVAHARGPNVAIPALLFVVAVAWYLAATISITQAALFLVGAAAGVVLYHAAFGFTSSWRHVITTGRGDGLRAQMVMLAATSLVFIPLIARGQVFGHAVRGSVAPVGLSVVIGAFLFGVGMQLGGGCASGTLYTAGGGSPRMLVTLGAFIAGSVVGLLHTPFWDGAPAFEPVSLLQRFGVTAALGISLVLFAVVAALSLAFERWRNGAAAHPAAISTDRRDAAAEQGGASDVFRRGLRGPWPLVAGALGLAAVNIATLLLAGRPWGVTSAFALWGSKLLAAAGANVSAWPYWQVGTRAADLQASVLRDVTSVMDLGIMAGALAASGLAGRFAPQWRVPARSLLAALVGGLLLGYGARIAYGCNIGAYFSGIASSSLHGWLWLVAAFGGNIAGTRLRPWFGLRVS